MESEYLKCCNIISNLDRANPRVALKSIIKRTNIYVEEALVGFGDTRIAITPDKRGYLCKTCAADLVNFKRHGMARDLASLSLHKVSRKIIYAQMHHLDSEI